MRKSIWDKLKSLFTTRAGDESQKERNDSFRSKLNVEEEYTEAFRTKSYEEMWNKAQGQLGRTSFNRLSSTSSNSISFYVHLSDYLLEPQQETLMKMIESLHFHHLLINYFEASVEAYSICELLLRSVHQTRTNYNIWCQAIFPQDLPNNIVNTAEEFNHQIKHLAAFALRKNPLSIISRVQFRDYHNNNMLLFKSLTSKGKKIRRKAKFNKLTKKVGAYSLLISQSALLIAFLVFVLHSMVGVVAAPALMAPCLVLLKRKLLKLVINGVHKTSMLENFAKQLDVASRGVYILINDFETISRMVNRLYDEVDHRKDAAKLCVRSGKLEILEEVLKEFHMHDSSFVEQLKELEDHIYLCFLTINRSRRLVLQEIMVPQD